MLDVTVVIPTYHERENLSHLLPALFATLDDAGLQPEVVVVDDNSRDGTDELCQRLAANHPLRLIIRRNERGLATAVLRGLHAARGSVCVVMDADFSHPPAAVPALVEAACSPDCDMAIGSRYVAGGEVDQHWSRFRRLNSRVASLLARGLTPVADPMSGFFALRADVLSRAPVLRPLGYKIALELLVRCDCRNVAELPIHFQDRAAGESKLSLGQQWLYLRHLARLYPAKLRAKFMRRTAAAPVGVVLPRDERRAA
jgi:dolichol-phosphate mannosyltransferase